jgi:uncharacterized protein
MLRRRGGCASAARAAGGRGAQASAVAAKRAKVLELARSRMGANDANTTRRGGSADGESRFRHSSASDDRPRRRKPLKMDFMAGDHPEPLLLGSGDALEFADRDQLLEALDRLDQAVPARHEGRTTAERERFVMLRYLRVLAGADAFELPAKLTKHPDGANRPPDFTLEWPTRGAAESFELTDGSTQDYQKRLSATSTDPTALILPVDINTPERDAAELWAKTLFAAFLRKTEDLARGRYALDHLLIYDLTGLGLLLPLERGEPILTAMIRDWLSNTKPEYHFRRVSVVRDLALLLNVSGNARVLPLAESPYFRFPVLRARDEGTLQENLRKLDRFCRVNSIRHLKAFGSVLGNTVTDFEDDDDLDLLVEFETGARVTLLDMARMERELTELTGFRVDLRTASDLSRYFRQDVLQEAAELGAVAK